MAGSTLQYDVLVKLSSEIKDEFRHDPKVPVHSDLLWYAVRGRPRVSRAPDVMVILGRPKVQQESYLQWNEGNIAPQVTIEVRSRSNTERNLAETAQSRAGELPLFHRRAHHRPEPPAP